MDSRFNSISDKNTNLFYSKNIKKESFEKNKLNIKDDPGFEEEKHQERTKLNNLTKVIKENNLYLDKVFEKHVDDLFTIEKIQFEDFDNNIINSDISTNEFSNLNPFFSVFSTIHQKLIILLPIISKETTNKSKNFIYYLYFFDKNGFFKKTKILFDFNFSESYHGISDDQNFKITKMLLHQKNQNQLCFFSSTKIALLDDLNGLMNKKDLVEITINLILDLSIVTQKDEEENFNDSVKKTTIIKFAFWDFDNHFGILTSNKVLKIFYFKNEGNFEDSFKNISNINLSGITQEVKSDLNEVNLNELNIIDFDFGRCNLASIWEPFSLFFLDISGKILYCTPIFPLKINIDYLMPFKKMKKFINLYSHLEKEIEKNSKTYKNYSLYSKSNKENFDKNEFDIENYLANENIINNLIELKKNQIQKKDYNKGSNKKNNRYENQSNNSLENQMKSYEDSTIEINEYLNYFNKRNNVYLKNIEIIDKRYSTDKLKLNLNLLDSLCLSTNKNSFLNNQSNFGKYTNIKVLNTFPMAFIRIYENENIDVIVLNNQLEPIRKENNYKISDSFLIESKNLKLPFKEKLDYNHNKNKNFINFFNNKRIHIIENPINNTQIAINIFSDVYLINLDFLKSISNKFYRDKEDSRPLEDCYKNINLNIVSELIPIIKINYSKLKDFKNKKFSFIGFNFFNIKLNIQENNSKNKILTQKERYKNKLFILGFDNKNRIINKEYICYQNISEIYLDEKYLKNKMCDFSEFVSKLYSKPDHNKDLKKFLIKLENYKNLESANESIQNLNSIREM